MAIITLITDFGWDDWFVGTMKGVVRGIAPSAELIDITHGIAPGDIRAGAFALAEAAPYFPRRTIHLVVIDPGVGSNRAGLAIDAGGQFFVAPDNGVLSWALRDLKVKRMHQLDNSSYRLEEMSHTFHGRDLFAPAAAHLAAGVAVQKLGKRIHDIVNLPWPEPVNEGDTWIGEVVYLDRFGNAITSLTGTLSTMTGANWVQLGSRRRIPIREYYQEVGEGKPVAVVGSTGLLEVGINGGDAAKTLKLKPGSKIRLIGSNV